MIRTHTVMGRASLFFLGLTALLAASMAARAESLDLDTGIVHGQVIDDEFVAGQGVTVSADNFSSSGNRDIAVIFDSTSKQGVSPDFLNDGDDDLRGPWDRGNIASNEVLGNMLIIPEHGENDGGFLDADPDDEGSRPAGTIMFAFDKPIDSFGFDLIDVEGTVEYTKNNSSTGYFAAFHMGGTELAKIDFGQLINNASPFYDASIVYGDNSANRIAPITIAGLISAFSLDSTLTGFDKVVLGLGGSGAITGVNFTHPPENTQIVPTPTALPAGLALFAGAMLRRRRHR